MRSWGALLVLGALWLAPVIAIAVAVPLVSARERVSVETPLPSVVAVGSQSTDYRASVSVVVQFEQAHEVRSPTQGVLTSTADSDSAITAGEELFAVNGTPVLAQYGSVPFHRTLEVGDEGEDVKALGEFFRDMGLLEQDQVGNEFGSPMRSAVLELQRRLDVQADGVFSPTYVAYVPKSAHRLGEALVDVGASVNAGQAVFLTAPGAEQVTFAPTSASASLLALHDAPLTLHLGETQVQLATIDPTGQEVTAIEEQLALAVSEGKAQIAGNATPGSGERVSYNGGMLSLAEPEVKGVVPGSAVHVTQDGAQCLFLEDGEGGWSVVPLVELEPAVGTIGALYVDPELVGAQVSRDPLSLNEDVRAECR